MTSQKPKYLASIGRLLGFASAGTKQLSDRRLRKYGLTVQQWVPLTALWRTSPLSESELAEYCRMSPSSLNRILDRMEVKKFVRRSKDPSDRRRTLVALGTKGRSLSHLLDFYSDINEELLSGINSQEREQLIVLLQKVIANLENLEDES